MQVKSKIQPAFSLIEVLFLIVVLSIIAVYAINLSSKRSQEALADKTASMMQQWLQATNNYYTTHQNTWPQTWNDLINTTPPLLPDSAQCSSIISTQTDNPQCQGFGYFYLDFPSGEDYKNASYIIIETQVPDQQLGQLIAGKLPNAKWENGIVSAAAQLSANQALPTTYYDSVVCGAVEIPPPASSSCSGTIGDPCMQAVQSSITIQNNDPDAVPQTNNACTCLDLSCNECEGGPCDLPS